MLPLALALAARRLTTAGSQHAACNRKGAQLPVAEAPKGVLTSKTMSRFPHRVEKTHLTAQLFFRTE